ncbi:MAG: GNAT family N-acetyltransferase, partial [Proteobacteria bacterium]
MPLHVAASLSAIDAAQWDALLPEPQPFLRHAFLSALEDSGSLGERSGWAPEHLLQIEDGQLVAALPS